MRQTHRTPFAFLLLLIAVAGCARHRAKKPQVQLPPLAGTASTTLPDSGGKIPPVVDYDSMPVEPDPNMTLEPCAHSALTAHEVQCMAATKSSVANVIQLEGVLACENSKSCWSFQDAEKLRSQLMAHRAVDLRNQTAGIALRAFYNLALAEASLEPLESALTELEAAVVDVEKLEASELPSPVDSRDLRQRRLELLSQQAELEANIVKLGEQVAVALALNPCCRTSISPSIDWSIDPQPIDACVAVEQGLSGRADLAQMRMVMQSLSSDTLPAAQAALQAVEGGLGQLDQRLRLLHMIMPGPSAEVEVPVRRSQVNRVLSEQQRLIGAQIRSAISEMDSRSRRAAIARRTLVLRLEQLADVQSKIKAEQANAFDEVEAKLNVYKAQGELVAEIIGWKLANVNFREAQGSLAMECGYSAGSSCNCYQ